MTAAAAGLPRVPAEPNRAFRDAAKMEWIKLRTLRSSVWALVGVTVSMIGIGVATMANTKPPSAAKAAAFDPTNNVLAGIALGQLVVGVIGVLAVTGEYSSGSIRSTLAAVPNRRLMLAAKAAVIGGVSLIVSEVITFVTFFAGRAALSDAVPHPALDQPGVVRALLLSGLYLPMIGVIGVALGAIVRHTAAAIAAQVALVFVVPAILAGFTGTTVAKFLPSIIASSSLAVAKPDPDTLHPWAGFAVLWLYVAAALVLGDRILARRDV
ncbi:ABC transporter permease subunit [Streptomyces varsoviensis]|uniref:ABC transporter permease subunit n=1 Tax=Streptomyces varsoviensis TaxID=67373 RepID=UPI00340B1B3E